MEDQRGVAKMWDPKVAGLEISGVEECNGVDLEERWGNESFQRSLWLRTRGGYVGIYQESSLILDLFFFESLHQY